jgi:Right handed beta helix region
MASSIIKSKMLASLLALSTIYMSDLYATIIHVPADHPTISLAISAASPGDTIIVAAGAYHEQVVINVENLTLLGAQANVDARTRTFIPANESIITFAAPTFGTGIVNIVSPNVIFNGFTVQGNIVNSTAAIFAGDPGNFLPSTATIDVTGLQLLNNIVQNNANGILIASIEPTPKTLNYLVQFNYLQNNSGDPGSGNGQGVFFNNSGGTVMTNVVVTENLFNGMETSSSVNLSNVTTATVRSNVMNQDNSIALFGTTDVSISGNVTSGATGIISGLPSNTADAIFVGFGCSNTTITDNLIYTATANGISIFDGNSDITITDNCIVDNTLAGISLNNGGGVANSNITINNNNIRMNTTGLILAPDSYTSTPSSLDATSNYWNSASGPNYNGTGPGTGDLITDNNIPAAQTVVFTPFLTDAIVCPSPVTLTNTTTSVNVPPGTPVSFVVTITVAAGEVSFNAISFTDPLPSLASGSAWTIATQSPSGFFTITGAVGSQHLALTATLPSQIAPGTYTVTLTANTTLSDAGETLPSTATMTIQIDGPTGISQNISATATASVAAAPPPSPPTNFHGEIQKNRFLNKTEYVLKSKWDPSPSIDVVLYRIFENGHLVDTVLASSPLIFITCLNSKHEAGRFQIVAVNSENLESIPISIRITHEGVIKSDG